jgi:hypothetical protein
MSAPQPLLQQLAYEFSTAPSQIERSKIARPLLNSQLTMYTMPLPPTRFRDESSSDSIFPHSKCVSAFQGVIAARAPFMKITRIESIPVCVPLKKGMTTKTAHGEHVTSPYVIVRVHTDEGIIGIGEATVSQLWSGENQSTTLAVLKELIEPALLGKDPRNITEIRRKMDSVLKLHPFTKAAVEMAMWDIAENSSASC